MVTTTGILQRANANKTAENYFQLEFYRLLAKFCAMISCKVHECCCISLKCGTVMLGVAGLLASSIYVIVSCFSTDLEFGLEHILGVPLALVYFLISILLLYGVFEVRFLTLFCKYFLSFFFFRKVQIAFCRGM